MEWPVAVGSESCRMDLRRSGIGGLNLTYLCCKLRGQSLLRGGLSVFVTSSVRM